MRTRLNFEKHRDSPKFYIKTIGLNQILITHMDSNKISIFVQQQSVFYIYTTTIFLVSKVFILFEIHTKIFGALALIFADTSSQLPPLTCIFRPSLI